MRANALHILTLAIATLTACGPKTEIKVNELPPIFPDYVGVTIPVNIAPLNFGVRQAESVEAVFCVGDEVFTFSGKTIEMPERTWKEMLKKAKDTSLEVNVSATTGDTLRHYKPFSISVSSDSIDKYLSYRLIEPGFEVWDRVSIVERDIETFDETVLSKGTLVENACMNCHTYSRNGRSFFHLRGEGGGTIVSEGGQLRKLDLKPEGSKSAATYGELHPEGRFGIFSTNTIIPAMHSQNEQRLEVFDSESDLIVADLEERTIACVPCATGEEYLETFPCFASDGRSVFFCRAPFAMEGRAMYDVVRARFDPQTGAVSDTLETVWNATERGASASFPKASPDGRWLMITASRQGTFPIWHRDADLVLIDLRSRETVDMTAANDTCSDSYHAWSSSSRWVVFASKRTDGVYGRPYFCHIDTAGTVSKPFVLPQQSPEYYDLTLRSFNIPELSPTSAGFDAWQIHQIKYNTTAIPFKLIDTNE